RDNIILARTPANPLSPPDLCAATIATILGNKFLHRITRLFDCAVLLLIAAALPTLRRVERMDLVLWGIVFTAAYCLVALGTVAGWHLWLPGVLPLGAFWLAILLAFVLRKKDETARETAIVMPPPTP
ncbi:MAG: hypothetical protein ABI883_07615, partial [Chthoniobacterales bacterium]